MVKTEDRGPAVVIHPPLLYGGALILALLLDWFLPLGLLTGLGDLRFLLAAAVGLPGVAIAAVAVLQFRRARTQVPTFRATSALVTDGLYRYSRNPIYVALILLQVALALLLGSAWMLVFTPLLAVATDLGVIRREEAYLEAKFGDSYRSYRQRVRRWL